MQGILMAKRQQNIIQLRILRFLILSLLRFQAPPSIWIVSFLESRGQTQVLRLTPKQPYHQGDPVVQLKSQAFRFRFPPRMQMICCQSSAIFKGIRQLPNLAVSPVLGHIATALSQLHLTPLSLPRNPALWQNTPQEPRRKYPAQLDSSITIIAYTLREDFRRKLGSKSCSHIIAFIFLEYAGYRYIHVPISYAIYSLQFSYTPEFQAIFFEITEVCTLLIQIIEPDIVVQS